MNKDQHRAKQFVYRNGVRIPRVQWDRGQRKLKEASDTERLKKIGLSRGAVGIMTPDEVLKQRKPIK